MDTLSFLSFHDLIFVLPHLNRSELSKRTGIPYQTISSKLHRYRRGQEVGFTLEQSEAIREYLFQIMDKLELILIQEQDGKNNNSETT